MCRNRKENPQKENCKDFSQWMSVDVKDYCQINIKNYMPVAFAYANLDNELREV